MVMRLPINPKIITWARERVGLSIEGLATRMKRDPEEIQQWESGNESPSYTLLEQLAYRHLKIPLAVFFLPEPPDVEDPVKKFRRLPANELERFSPDTYIKIRLAQAYQDSVELLMQDIGTPRKIFLDISPGSKKPPEVARIARIYLGINLDEQTTFRSTETAFKAWRHVIEEAGIFTFKDSLEDRFVSGFSLMDEKYPIIFVNNTNAISRQVFTLIHELGHILYGISGVTDIDESYLNLMNDKERILEKKCNEFAAHFLVPDETFAREIEYFRKHGLEGIKEIADHYSVSREVVLRRLFDHGEVTKQYYEEKAAEWNRDYLRRERLTTGGNYYLTRLAYLGEGFARLAFQNYYQGRFSPDELARHLNINARLLPKLETYMRW